MTHRHAKGFEGSAAEVYDRGRAPYPRAVIEALGLPRGVRVLDLAAGTGLLTSALKGAGFDVVSVEPSAAMRKRVPSALEGSAESIPLGDGAVGAVVAGDAWHWFDSDRAAVEVHRVLAPGGALVLVWRRPEGPRYEGPLADRLRKLRGDHPGFVGDQGRGGVERHGGFAELAHTTVAFTHASDQEGQLAMLASASFVATLPEAERRELLELAAVQLPAGPIEIAYRADVWRAGRL